MKKVFCILLAMMCLLPAIASAEINWAGMTVEEIQAEIDHARAEIVTRDIKTPEKGTVILDADGLVVSITSIEFHDDDTVGCCLKINYTMVNNSSTKMGFKFDSVYLNGWKLDAYLSEDIDAGMKARDYDYLFDIEEDADVGSYEDLEELKLIMTTFGPLSFDTITKGIETTIYFD